MNYFTGVGGFANLSEGGAGSYYQGPAGQMLGSAVAAFSASAMFMANLPATSSADGDAIFDASTGVGPITAGWRLFTRNVGDVLEIGAVLAGNAALVTALAQIDLATALIARPLFIATFSFNPVGGASNDGQVRLSVNGTQFVTADFAEGNAYVPAAAGTSPAIGAQDDSATQAAAGSYVLGCGFLGAGMSQEQTYRQQLVCLEAGDFVDGAQGGAFSAGVVTFDNLYSARRGNSAFGATAFINGVSGGLTVGQVPTAAAVWADENGANNFTRIDDGIAPSCFTTGFKRIG